MEGKEELNKTSTARLTGGMSIAIGVGGEERCQSVLETRFRTDDAKKALNARSC